MGLFSFLKVIFFLRNSRELITIRKNILQFLDNSIFLNRDISILQYTFENRYIRKVHPKSTRQYNNFPPTFVQFFFNYFGNLLRISTSQENNVNEQSNKTNT